MKKSISVRPKSPGRPATGRDKLISARLPDEMISDLDSWARANSTTRSEAIRRLVELGLASSKPPVKR